MRPIIAVLTALVVVTACSGGSDDADRERSDADEVDSSIPTPTGLDAQLLSDDEDALLELSFESSAEADGYLLDFGDGSHPALVAHQACRGDDCRVVLNRLAVAGVASLTVAAIVGEGRSERSDAVHVPEWPEPEPPPELGPDDPVTLVVVRRGDDGSLAVTTEQVRVGDAEARVAALDADPAVVGVQVEGTADDSQEDDGAADGGDDIPALVTWYEEALDFDRLPPEPRGEGVVVAVVEGGVDAEHSVFDGVDVETIPMLDAGVVPSAHATGVASMIAASPDSPMPSLAAGATIRNYDVKGGAEDTDIPAAVQAIIRAVDEGADVINVSWVESCGDLEVDLPGPDLTPIPIPVHLGCEPDGLQAAIEYAEQHGVVVVAAAGNDGDGEGCSRYNDLGPNEDHWPAKFPTVIAVGGTDPGGDVYRCSPDKDYIDVLAPGDELLVATTESLPGVEGYGVADGTSYAAPLVSGIVAVMLAEQPDLTPAEVRDMLARATDENGRLVPGVVMAELGVVPEGPFVDPATLETAYPYSLELRFDPGHPIPEAGQAVENAWMAGDLNDETDTLSPDFWGDPGGADGEGYAHVTFRGTLFVDDEGRLTGYGVMDALGPETDENVTGGGSGHMVSCPLPEDGPRPHILFGWSIPVAVDGELVLDDDGDEADLSLSLSPGQGATPGQQGELPGITVLHDDLSDCQSALHAAPEGWNLPCRLPPCPGSVALCQEGVVGDACFDEVARARDELVDLTETLHEEIVGLGTVTFADDISLRDDIAGYQTALDDEVHATLRLGSSADAG